MTIRQLHSGETDGYRPWAENVIETYSTQLCAREIQITDQPTNQTKSKNLTNCIFARNENRCLLLWWGIPTPERIVDI
jgi:hypothetical protein